MARVNKALRFALLIALALSVNFSRATEEKEETFGDKLKKLFVRPTPTPRPHKKRRSATPASTKTPTVSPSETPASSASPAEPGARTTPQPSETVTASVSIAQSPTPSTKAGTQYFEAVRPINPPPRRHVTTPRPRQAAPQTEASALPTMTVLPQSPFETPALRPVPSLPPLDTTPEIPVTAPAPSAGAQQTPSPAPLQTPVSTAVIPADQISDSATYSPEVRKIIDLALDLTGRNLGYKYVSADPKNGGLDSSGFIYYVLIQSGVTDVPRDAREQYIWARKAGTFQAVLAQRDDTFELDALKPGDLLFWASNYGISRDPDITQTMIYLGREKGTNQRLMVGASEARSLRGQKKPGVGVFEFKVGHAARKPNEESGPFFVGYGQIPGLRSK